jgi:hypothetical protein
MPLREYDPVAKTKVNQNPDIVLKTGQTLDFTMSVNLIQAYLNKIKKYSHENGTPKFNNLHVIPIAVTPYYEMHPKSFEAMDKLDVNTN